MWGVNQRKRAEQPSTRKLYMNTQAPRSHVSVDCRGVFASPTLSWPYTGEQSRPTPSRPPYTAYPSLVFTSVARPYTPLQVMRVVVHSFVSKARQRTSCTGIELLFLSGGRAAHKLRAAGYPGSRHRLSFGHARARWRLDKDNLDHPRLALVRCALSHFRLH